MRRRVAMLVAALVCLMGCVVLVPMPALADSPNVPNCPDGSVATLGGRCIAFDGSDAGGGVVQPVTPTPPAYPSSVLASLSGSGSSTNQTTNIAIVNASGKNGVSFSKGASITSNIGSVVSGLNVGFQIGKQISSAACSFGIKDECYPQKTPPNQYVPNSDVGPTSASGWYAGKNTLNTTGGNSGGVTYAFSIAQGYQQGSECGGNTGNPCGLVITVSPYSTNHDATFSGTAGSLTQNAPGAGSANDPSSTYGCGGASGDIDIDQTGHLSSSSAVCGSAQDPPNSGNYVGIIGGGFRICSPDPSSGNCIVYLFPGNPQRPPDQQADPLRWWVTESTCGNNSVDSAASDKFHEDDATFPQYPDASSCNNLTAVKVIEKGDGTPDHVMWTWTAPPAYQQFAQTYPQCTPGSDQTCELGLWNMQTGGARNCYTSNDLCAGWFQDANKSSDYQCTYGIDAATKYDSSQDVALSECTVLAPTFDPEQQARGNPYGNPNTGAPPDDNKGSGSSNNGSSGSGDGDGTGGDPSCYPTGWGKLNPVEWIVKPIMCLARYLFMPSSSDLSDSISGLSDSVHGTSLGSWGSSLSGVGQLGNITSDSCGGVPLHIPSLGPIGGGGDYQLASTCDAPWSTVSTVVRALITVVIAWMTLMSCYRIIGGAFGMEVPTKGAS